MSEFKGDFDTLSLKKYYFIQNLQEELKQFSEKHKGIIEQKVSEFIQIYTNISETVI